MVDLLRSCDDRAAALTSLEEEGDQLAFGFKKPEAAAARRGKPLEPQKLEAMKSQIIDVFEKQMDVFATSGRLLDDGVIDPRDTRAVLINVLAICREAEQRNPQPVQFSVARP